MTNIVLCADDYGQNPEISQAIIHLIDNQRLSATSCMTTSQFWPEQAVYLKPYSEKIDIGLHFNVTEGQALALVPRLASSGQLPSLSSLLLKSYVGLLSQQEIEQELSAQIEAFQKALGRLPDYIDGHQHVHQFPIIRKALIKVYSHYYPDKQAYVRVLNVKPRTVKEYILRCLGSAKLESMLRKNGIKHNSSFAGIYDLAATHDYRYLFEGFLQRSNNKGLIMCHPGLLSDDKSDLISDARLNEYQYLSSDDFIKDCKQHNMVIGRFFS